MDGMARAITLHQPRRLEIGEGAAGRLGEWARDHRRIFVLATEHTKGFLANLGLSGEITLFADIPPEPDTAALERALEAARKVRPDLVVGLGGGSVLDVAKLVAVLWDGDQTFADVVGPGRVRGRNSALAQVPTTAGTGSEAGIRALVTDPATLSKLAVESSHMIADIAVLDPVLTYTVPPAVTAATGIDALAHCVEAFTSLRAHDMIDGFARMGIGLVGKYLRRAVENGHDTEARAGMMLASYYGGICLGPVNTAAGHAMAYPLGTRLKLPHGLANAIIFPHVLAFNTPATPAKTAEITTLLGLKAAPGAQDVLAVARRFCESLGVEMRLSRHGAQPDDLPQWAAEAHAIRRLMDNNPCPMTVEDVLGLYRAAYA